MNIILKPSIVVSYQLISLILLLISISVTGSKLPVPETDGQNDDSELSFCQSLPSTAFCDFGDDSLLRLVVTDHWSAELNSQLAQLLSAERKGDSVLLKELILVNVHGVDISIIAEFNSGIRALRLFNSTLLDLPSAYNHRGTTLGTSLGTLGTLEIVNSSFANAGQPFKFIQEHKNLTNILLTGLEYTTDELAETFGADEPCSRDLRELRLNHRCQKSTSGSGPKLELRVGMFQDLCRLRVLDLSCLPVEFVDHKDATALLFSDKADLPFVVR